MRIVILVTGNAMAQVAAERGDYDAWIRAATGDAWRGSWVSHDVRADAPLPGTRDADGFVIPGSSASVTERAPWMLRAEELVRGIEQAGVPLLGICFGHQMIAQALGGEVRRNPRGREIGTVRVERVESVGDDPLFAGLPAAFDVNATHVDSVVRLPPRAEVLARTSLDPAAAFRVGPSVRGVQFHPEFDAPAVRAYIAARAHLIRDEGGDPDALLAAVRDETRGADVLANFAAMVAGRR
ncbi:MAG TPA: glutamine amidotransferase [Polyangiaceae bacterium]|jgi:GMP synthase (glutamine-hydrolysing)